MTPEQLQAEREFIGLWRDELSARMQRAQAIAEGIGIRDQLHQAVQAEAYFFIRTCRALAELMPGSLDDQEEAA